MPQSRRILLVDDNKTRAGTLATVLENGPGAVQVMHASSLDAATEALRTVSVDALLLEGSCLTDGISQVKRIRDHFESLVIIVLVPREAEATGKQFFRAGACGYILEEELDGALLKETIRLATKRKRKRETAAVLPS